MEALTQAGLAAGVAFIAEMGDKSQFVIIAMAARGRPERVAIGSLAAIAVLTTLAAFAGAVFYAVLPPTIVGYASAAVFLASGVFVLARRPQPDTESRRTSVGIGGAFLLVIAAEMGDKTQIGIAALSAQGHPVATGIGGFVGMGLNMLVAVALGRVLGRKVPASVMRTATGLTFLAVGAMTVFAVLRS